MDKEGFLASITHHIRDIMFERGVAKQADLEMEILRRLGLLSDPQKHATVKRRIYDSLSTFLALDLLIKQDKTLFWKGFPGAEGALISRSVSLSTENDESSELQYNEQYFAGKTAEEIDVEIDAIQQQINDMETLLAHYDYFKNRKKSDKIQQVKVPFMICACKESRASCVLPDDYDGSGIRKCGLIFPKGCVQLIEWRSIVEQIVEREDE